MSDYFFALFVTACISVGVFGGFFLSIVGFYIGKAQAHRDRDEEQAVLLAAWPERPEAKR